MRLRAITIGIRDFDGYDDLDFVSDLIPQVGDAFRDLGYEVTEVAAQTLSAEDAGKEIVRAVQYMGADDVQIVHVISHGELAPGSLYLLGSDGIYHHDMDIAQWLVSTQNLPGRPLTLFLLDLCHGGTAARLPWQDDVDAEHNRGWVIAACRPRDAAYDGRFSRALVNVLRGLNKQEFDIDPAVEHVPLPTVARAIRQEVNRLAMLDDSYCQTVTATQLDISADVDLPFFLNRGYGDSAHTRLRSDLNAALVPFLDELDEGLDARHFLDRASAVDRLSTSTSPLVGCFSGRKSQLQEQSQWMNVPTENYLCAVTGSPGVGKSALLGILVCAAHTRMREPTRPVWKDVEQTPYVVHSLAAVHARQRSAAAIARSIAAQLGLHGTDLVADLATATEVPVIVVDALDEADNPVAVMQEVLLPLVQSRRARLLVGVRPYPEFDPLMSDLVFNLDDVTDDQLEQDLYLYVTKLLRTVPSYRRSGAAVGGFASEVAQRLSRGTSEWGSFLIAGLYTRHVLSNHPHARDLPADLATSLGAAIPLDLPSVLELDLNGRADQPHLRPVLEALAHARGQGMPVSVLARVAARTPEQTRNALQEAKYYLRQATDIDHTTVYRLFHQGLADHLSDSSIPLLDKLLSPLGPAESRDWDAAEPYVLRTVLSEAGDRLNEIITDPGFILLTQAVDLLATCPEVPHIFLDFVRGVDDAESLALAAARAGYTELAARAAVSGPAPLVWQPRWVVGTPHKTESIMDSVVATRRSMHPVRTIAISGDGSVIAALREDNSITRWNVREPTEELLHVLPGRAQTLAVNRNASEIAVSVGAFTTWFTGLQMEQTSGTPNVQAIAISPFGSNTVSVSTDGVVALTYGKGETATINTGWVSGTWAASWDAGPVIAAGVGTLVRLWDCEASIPGRVLATGSLVLHVAVSADASTVVCFERDGFVSVFRGDKQWGFSAEDVTALAVSADGLWLAVGHSDGGLTFSPTSNLHKSHVNAHTARVTSLAVSNNGSVVASGANNGSVHMWRPRRQPIANATSSSNHRAITTFATLRETVIVGGPTGHVDQLHIASGDLVRALSQHDSPVKSITSHPMGSRNMVQVFWKNGRRGVWDPRTGSFVRIDAWPGFPDLEQASAARCAVFVRDRLAVVEGTAQGDVLLRDVESQKPISVLPSGHENVVTAVAIGRVRGEQAICTGGADRTVRVWTSIETPPEVIEVPGSVSCVGFTANGRLLVAAGGELIAFDRRKGL